MGGLTCYHLSLNHKYIFDGVILISPAFKTHFGSFVAGISNFLSKILPSKTRLMRPISGKSTGNPQISEDFYKDPYSTVR
jgi:alpha-beta hydrolase superfamily lysophospholipase